MVHMGQSLREDIKVLENFSESVCVFRVGLYQNFYSVPSKPYCVDASGPACAFPLIIIVPAAAGSRSLTARSLRPRNLFLPVQSDKTSHE